MTRSLSSRRATLRDHRGTLLASCAVAASTLVLAALGAMVAPTASHAFTCDSVTNPAGGNSGATDGGVASATACGTNATATNASDAAFGDDAEATGLGIPNKASVAIGPGTFARGAGTTSVGAWRGIAHSSPASPASAPMPT